MPPTLVILAAGQATRFGRPKQLQPVGPAGDALLDYTIHDALRAGFARVVVVVRPEMETAVRQHVEPRFADMLSLAFAPQRLDDRPPSRRPAADRVRPWGTAHAVWAARPFLEAPFAVCNADDFYGAAAHEAAVTWFQAPGPDARAAVLGYRLDTTLSGAGGVNRALCTMGAGGDLHQIEELRNVERGTGGVRGVSPGGTTVAHAGDELVSMNYWIFPATVLGLLEGTFDQWLEGHGDDPHAEFLLPWAVNQLIAARNLEVRVIPVAAEWMGITFADDTARVARRLADLHAAGVYPAHLGRRASAIGT